MVKLLIILACVGVCWFIEHVYYRHLDTLPEDKRNELIKRQSQMHCPNCGFTYFEVVGMVRGKAQFQCKRCKKVR